jgi:hypothetical protein
VAVARPDGVTRRWHLQEVRDVTNFGPDDRPAARKRLDDDSWAPLTEAR